MKEGEEGGAGLFVYLFGLSLHGFFCLYSLSQLYHNRFTILSQSIISQSFYRIVLLILAGEPFEKQGRWRRNGKDGHPGDSIPLVFSKDRVLPTP